MHTINIYINHQAAWNYYDNQTSTSDSFSKEEQESWNSQKKNAADAKK